jgi:hypothetical protein
MMPVGLQSISRGRAHCRSGDERELGLAPSDHLGAHADLDVGELRLGNKLVAIRLRYGVSPYIAFSRPCA